MQKRGSAKAVEQMQVIRLPNGKFQEAFITIPAVGFEEPADMFHRLYEFLADNPRLRIVRQDVFGVISDPQEIRRTKAYRLDGAEWPVTWVEQGNGEGAPVAGIQVHAVAGVSVRPVRLDGHVVGTVFEDEAARYCILGGLRPNSTEGARDEQAWETFEVIEAALERVGMGFASVFRTWFYLDDILEWYGQFNQVRNQFFKERRVYDGLVPASTGVGGSNSSGTAVVADVLAIEPKGQAVRLAAVASPLQCPAPEYGSSFSRAVELILPSQRRLYVSGTASIAVSGETLHVGDAAQQIARTMQVVEAILNARQMGWEDVTRAIGYIKHVEDAPVFDAYCRSRRLPRLPVVIAKNDICRDDLLFEIEVDAARLGVPANAQLPATRPTH